MPNKDGTGPDGLGPNTGRGAGPCAEDSARRGKGPRDGRGRGRGPGLGLGPRDGRGPGRRRGGRKNS